MKDPRKMTDTELVDELCIVMCGGKHIFAHDLVESGIPLREEILRRMALRDREE